MSAQDMLLQDVLTTAINAERENIILRDENRHLRRGYFIACYVACASFVLQILALLIFLR